MKTLLHKFLIPVIGILAVSYFIVALYIPTAIHDNAVAQLVKSSVSTTEQFKTIRGYYTKNVVGAAKKAGMTPHFEYKGKDGFFPLPATMIHEISEALKSKGTEINLYSPYPFPNRSSRQLDSFQREAWDYLVNNPQDTYFKEIEVGGEEFLRVAIADTMQAQGCVNCHNNHPDTPKADWNLNDVRGVLEVVTPLKEVNESTAMLNATVTSLLVFSLIIISAIMVYLFRRFIRKPLKSLEQSLNSIASGEADLNSKLTIDSNDELGRISHSFNAFVDKLKVIVTNLITVSNALKEHSTEVSNVAHEVKDAAGQQMRESEMLATAVNEMTASIAEIENNSQQASSRIDGVTENVDDSNESTKKNVSAIHTLSSDVADVVNVINELQEESHNIGSVLDVIKAIAEQTNLLALNAAIEAARAGEQGRGFAVVADEVRALAGRTQESTIEIQTTVEKLQQRAQSASKVIEASSTHTSECVELSDQVSEKLSSAHQQVDELQRLTNQITVAIREQSNVTGEIDQNVIRLNDAANNILVELSQLSGLTEGLDKTSDEISVELGKFKI